MGIGTFIKTYGSLLRMPNSTRKYSKFILDANYGTGILIQADVCYI